MTSEKYHLSLIVKLESVHPWWKPSMALRIKFFVKGLSCHHSLPARSYPRHVPAAWWVPDTPRCVLQGWGCIALPLLPDTWTPGKHWLTYYTHFHASKGRDVFLTSLWLPTAAIHFCPIPFYERNPCKSGWKNALAVCNIRAVSRANVT